MKALHPSAAKKSKRCTLRHHRLRAPAARRAPTTTDIWVLPGTRLIVRQVAVAPGVKPEAASGPVHYYEEYEIGFLVSLYPSG